MKKADPNIPHSKNNRIKSNKQNYHNLKVKPSQYGKITSKSSSTSSAASAKKQCAVDIHSFRKDYLGR